MTYPLSAAILGLFLASASAADVSGLTVSMTRTPCFGLCPSYTVTINGDGKVAFEGRDHTAVKGPAEGVISAKNLRALAAAIEKASFFELKDEYSEMRITDQITVITKVEWDGRRKTVTHYHGDTSAPPRLRALEDRIDQLAGTSRWIKTR